MAIFPPLLKSALELVLDNQGELSVSPPTNGLTWGISVPGDPSQTVSLSTT